MPHIETPDDLADTLADRAAVYGAHDEACTEEKPCRVCWCVEIADRIRASVRNEATLEGKAHFTFENRIREECAKVCESVIGPVFPEQLARMIRTGCSYEEAAGWYKQGCPKDADHDSSEQGRREIDKRGKK